MSHKDSRRAPRAPIVMAFGLCASVALALTLATAYARAEARDQKSLAAAGTWDAASSQELVGAYHKLHDAWNAMDVDALKRSIVGDDVLATFDVDPKTSEPIRLTSKADIDHFTDAIFVDLKAAHTKSVAEHPLIACRATATVGVCTEECKIQLFAADGKKQILSLRATAVGVKQPDGWKWIQWHMSQGAPLQSFDRDGKLMSSNSR